MASRITSAASTADEYYYNQTVINTQKEAILMRQPLFAFLGFSCGYAVINS